MERKMELFMQAMGAALENREVAWGPEVDSGTLLWILQLAQAHRVLPMVYQALGSCPGLQEADRGSVSRLRRSTRQMIVLQTRKTAEFLPLLDKLCLAGVQPLLVKGIICRRLYPNPDYRLSTDEDIWIPPEQFESCHRILSDWGLSTSGTGMDSYEVPYRGNGSELYLEIHKSLFPGESEAYGDLNRFFADARSRAVTLDGVPTLCPTDHMLYLICHAFKHFLHSGFGIRQVCDMILYANAFGPEIDWLWILDCCRQIRAEQFAAGLFRIGRKYLHFSLEKSRYPLQWQAIYVDEGLLLEDILLSGIYGSAEKSRLHSSTITLQAVANQKKGIRRRDGVLKSLFPAPKTLENRYPYLKTSPLLAPVAWTDRILRYGKESVAGENRPTDSARVGKERVELLRKYGILDKKG